MFVSQKRFDRLLSQAAKIELQRLVAEKKFHDLLKEWNDLVRQINAGHYVLASSRANGTFTADEIDTLVRLCHPDKHGGSNAANEMTARLLALRKKD